MQPLGIADDRVGQKAAVGKDGERVAERGGVFGDLPRGIGRFRDQAIEEMDGIVRDSAATAAARRRVATAAGESFPR